MEEVAIIGSGLSGLVTLKTALENGYTAKIFGRESTCGGLWKYQSPSEECPGYLKPQTNDNFVHPLNKSTVTNTAAFSTYFSDFHLEKSRGFLAHEEVLDYLTSYADHFKLHAYIQYDSNVIRLDKHNCQWQVTYQRNGQTLRENFKRVFVATGLFRYPRIPVFRNSDLFQGIFIHSSQVRDEKALFSGKRVLVIGGSFSGGELAYYALKANASHVFLVQSSDPSKKVWLWNRFEESAKGLIEWEHRITYENCVGLNGFFATLKDIVASIDGKSASEIPNFPEGLRCIVESKEFLKEQIDGGKLTVVKSTVSEFHEKGVTFSDGSALQNLDIVVAATGFRYNFPFLAHILDHEKPITFYRRMLPVEKCLDGLAFVMIAYSSINFPLAEMQARWLCHNFLPKKCIDNCGLLYSKTERQQMIEAVAKLTEAMGSSFCYIADKNPYQTMHEIANEINALPPDHKELLASPVRDDVELGVALYHGPFTTLRYRIASDRSTPQREAQIIKFAKDVMGSTFQSYVDKYMNI